MGKEEGLSEIFEARRRDRAQARTKRQRTADGRPDRFGDVLSKYFNADPTALRKIEETRLIMNWSRVVGAQAAKVSSAVRFRGQVLLVAVKDSLWMQELLFLKPQLLKKLRAHFPHLSIQDLFFQLGPL